MKKSSIRIATFYNQVAMMGNVAVGVLLLPYIYYRFGAEVLELYVKIIAIKSVIEIFTSALGGGLVREMIEVGSEHGFSIAKKLFFTYAFTVAIVAAVGNYIYSLLDLVNFLMLSLLVTAVLIQQPYLQKMTALGYQQIPPLARLANSIIFLLGVLITGEVATNPAERQVFLCLAFGAITSLLITFGCHVQVVGEHCLGPREAKSTWSFIIRSLSGYALFAAFLSLCFQIEVLYLSQFVEQALFLAIIMIWKVPNILIQFMWRYSEVGGVHLKREKDNIKRAVQFRDIERKVLVIAAFASVAYLILSPFLYRLWLGPEMYKGFSYDIVLVNTLGLMALSMARVYSAYVQYSDRVRVLAAQYIFICLAKVVFIVLYSSIYPLVSFLVWFFLEAFFALYNKRLVKRELAL